MGEIRTRDKRDKLRLLYAGCKTTDKRLQAVLMEALQACDDALNGPTPGTFLSSTNEAGGGASFSLLSGFTPMDAKRCIGELLDYHDTCVTNLGGDPEDANSFADADVYKLMMSTLVPVRRFKKDFTGIRYGAGFYSQ